MKRENLVIMGCRGIPGRHGGFETFAEELSRYLEGKNWHVVVYCQQDQALPQSQDQWHGITRAHIAPTIRGKLIKGAFGTILFDLYAVCHALRHYRKMPWLVLGYNSSFLNILPRLLKVRQIINMDGMEWQRDKWKTWQKVYLRLAYFIAGKSASHLVADHPVIETELQKHFQPDKITMIPYGSSEIRHCDPSVLARISLKENHYALIIARPVPENGILPIVKAWMDGQAAYPLVLVGEYDPVDPYQKAVIDSAAGQDQIVFLGPIYDHTVLHALRAGCRVYFHGYRVGGTNPSLLESMGAGAAIIAHDNAFNRWVAGEGAAYYQTDAGLRDRIRHLDKLPLDEMRAASRKRHQEQFQWQDILESYECLIKNWC